MLTQEWLKNILRYEPDTGNFYWLARSSRSYERLAGCRSLKDDYVRIGIDDKDYLAHRLAWLYVHGYWPEYVDHRNGVRYDNKIRNLREATKSQDQANRSDYGENRGVYKHNGYYRARIKVNGAYIHLGYHKTIEIAREAYRTAANKYFGEFAFHNRPMRKRQVVM